MFRSILDDEIGKVKQSSGNKFAAARALFDWITTDDNFAEFLTLPAYDYLD
jgi:malate synthase